MSCLRKSELTAPPVDLFLESTALAVRASLQLLDGPALTISAACASGLHALIRATMMIRGGEADRVLVVAAEASVSPIFLGSFRRMGVLPAEGVGCRPFDQARDGFLMSEAAAVCSSGVGWRENARANASAAFASGVAEPALTRSAKYVAWRSMKSLLSSARDCKAVVVTLRAGVRFAGFGQSSVVRS